MLRALLLLALLSAVLIAPSASACTMPPPGNSVDVGPAGVTLYPPCPPASNGTLEVRVFERTVALPWPGF